MLLELEVSNANILIIALGLFCFILFFVLPVGCKMFYLWNLINIFWQTFPYYLVLLMSKHCTKDFIFIF